MRGIGIFSPPLITTRTDDRSRRSMSGNAMIALTMAGASQTVVTLERSTSSTTAAASNDRWMSMVAPAASRDVVVRSKRRPRGRAGPQASPRSALVKPNSTRWARFFQARLAWVSMTPLGRPVVPDVYINRWMSSAAATTGATSLPLSRRVPMVVHPSGPPAARPARPARPGRPDANPDQAVGEPGRRLRRQLRQRVVADDGGGAGVLQDVADLGRGEPPVDRHGDGAQVVGGKEHLQELGAVVGEQRHDIAPDHPRRRDHRPSQPPAAPSHGR